MNQSSSSTRWLASFIVGIAISNIVHGDNVTVVNPSFEGLTGTDLAHFDSSGNLLPGHAAIGGPYSSDPAVEFKTSNPIPGWQVVGGAGTVNYSGAPYFVGGIASTDGQNMASANGFGSENNSLSQTLGDHYRVGVTYELKVDVGGRLDYPLGGYSISLYAGGSQVVFDNVRLTTTSVPEPSTWVLAATGTIALVSVGRQQSAKLTPRNGEGNRPWARLGNQFFAANRFISEHRRKLWMVR